MKDTKPERAQDLIYELYLTCECGNSGMVKLRHWERLRCVCGRIWWALQPKRHGQLKLFPWPGNGIISNGWPQQNVVDENHQKFLSHLDDSSKAVEVVAEHLRGLGRSVTINPISKAPTREQWRAHVDHGDIQTDRGVVEVKRLAVNFSSRWNWPFKDFIVCAKHAFRESAEAYYILSHDLRTAGIVRPNSKSQWTVDNRTDHRYKGVAQDFWIAPLSCVEWLKL